MPLLLLGVGGLLGGGFGYSTSGAIKEASSAGKYIATAFMIYIAYRFAKDAGWVGK